MKASFALPRILSRRWFRAWTAHLERVQVPRYTLLATVMLSVLGLGCQAHPPAAQNTTSVPAEVEVPASMASDPAEPIVEPPVTPAPSAVSGLADIDAAEPPVVDTVEVEPIPAPPALSTPAEEIVQLAQARVPNDVLLAYIEGANSPFALGAAEILYLTDLGVPAETIAAMVRRDQALKEQATATMPAPAITATAVPASAGQFADPQTVEEPPSVAEVAETRVPAFEVTPTAEAAPVEVAPPVQQVTNNYFYNSLSPYGTWRESPEYGWVWQPSAAVVEPDWRPYFHGGRWIWTDYGWYWHSYYSWGWAPFHYGRWYRSPSWGWVWAPGTVWGPAWVTWRYYDGFCGWAPLPPACGYVRGAGFTYYGARVGWSFGFGLTSACYSFVPVSGFYVARPWVYRVPPTQVNQFYGNTTVINNYVYGNNNTVINRGIGTEVVTTRTELRKVRIADTAGLQAGHAIRGERLSRDGSTLAVYRPNMPDPAPRPPAAITQRQEQAKVRTESLLQSRPVEAARLNAAAAAGNAALQRSQSSAPALAAPMRTEPGRAPGRDAPVAGPGRVESPGQAGPVSPRAEPQATRPERVGSGSLVGGPVAPVRPQGAATGSTVPAPAIIRPAPVGDRPAAVPARPSVPERSVVAPVPPSTGSRVEPIRERPAAAAPMFRPITPVRPQQPVRPAQPVAPGTSFEARPPVSNLPSIPSFQAQPRVETPRSAPMYRSPPAFVPSSPGYTPQPAPSPGFRAPAPSRPTITPSPIVRPSSSPNIAPAPARSSPPPMPSAPARPSSVSTPAPAVAPAPDRPSTAPSASRGSQPTTGPRSR